MIAIYQVRYGYLSAGVLRLAALHPSYVYLREASARAEVEDQAFRWWEAQVWVGRGRPDFAVEWEAGPGVHVADSYVSPLLTALIRGVPKRRWSAAVYRVAPLDQAVAAAQPSPLVSAEEP